VKRLLLKSRGTESQYSFGRRDEAESNRWSLIPMRFRFYVIGGHIHAAADRIKAIADRLLLVWRTVNPIGGLLNAIGVAMNASADRMNTIGCRMNAIVVG
jgi:hypothetical protein